MLDNRLALRIFNHMNRLSLEDRARILGMLVEGNSLRATSRLCDVSINTVTKFLVDLGHACRQYQDKAFHNLTCRRVQADEIWAFCGAKEKNASPEKKAQGWGDVWTWTAIDADSKLILSWLVGNRDASCATRFMCDVASRIKNRIQLTTDGYKAYFDAVEDSFVGEIDYAVHVKIYGRTSHDSATRYSPAQCIGIKINIVNGDPDSGHISTSYIERSNLTMRMGIRRFTRLTNGFSKKVENHAHAVAIHMMHYNFGRIHKTLRVTPAMEAGISDHVWGIEEVAGLLDAAQGPMKRGRYKEEGVMNGFERMT